MRIDVFDTLYAARGIHLDPPTLARRHRNWDVDPPAPVDRVRSSTEDGGEFWGGMGRTGAETHEESEGDDEKGEEEEKGNGAVVIKTGTGNVDSMGCLVFAM
ncbi:hypothetical protein PM082_012316 [Marasmius tenuissimus]|nr:hypothetical protein PM082_012316 [Marasmius tenuissimus]